MNKNNIEETIIMGGIAWRAKNTKVTEISSLEDLDIMSGLAANDSGFSIVKEFINTYYHDGWPLAIYDCESQCYAIIDCDISEMPQIVAHIYNIEKAIPIEFIGESPIIESYVVGMHCTCGRINFPGLYRAENGKLIPLQFPSF